MRIAESKTLQKLNILINRHIDNPALSIDLLCEELAISRSQLHRVLKLETGLSLSLYIRKKRLARAESLLIGSELRISEIADAVGINTPQNFSKYFAEAYELNPSEYRHLNKRIDIALPSENKSIAVLPFVNMSPDEDQEYFSDGITEEIINQLVKANRLKVAGRTSSFSFKNKNIDLREIGQKLGVGYVLEGSVRKSNTKIRITAQLIEVKNGYHLWSENYDFEIEDIFQIQDEIAVAILKEVKVLLLGEKVKLSTPRQSIDPDAYNLYLRGLYFQNKFSNTEYFYKAINFYELALEIEPKYLECYTGICSCYMMLWFFSQVEASKSVEKAKEALHSAMQIDASNVEVLIRQGQIKTWNEWDLKGAIVVFDKAFELEKNTPELLLQAALCNTFLERFDIAFDYFQKVKDIDPLSGIVQFAQIWAYWWKGDFKQAEGLTDSLIAYKPNFWGGYYFKSIMSIENLHLKNALKNARICLELYPSSMMHALVGNIYFYFGQKDKTIGIVKTLEINQDKYPVSNFDIGQLYVLLGDFEKGKEFLDKALQAHEGRLLFIHKTFRRNPELKANPLLNHIFKAIEDTLHI